MALLPSIRWGPASSAREGGMHLCVKRLGSALQAPRSKQAYGNPSRAQLSERAGDSLGRSFRGTVGSKGS